MFLYLSQIAQQFTETTGSIYVDQYDHAGRIAQATSPSLIYSGNKTFAFGNKLRETNHAGLAFEYDGNGSVIWCEVGTGTDVQDQSNHPRLVGLLGSDNHIYCYRTNPHVSDFIVYRSVSANTIANGFVEHFRSTQDRLSYPNLFKSLTGRINLYMRSSTDTSNNYSLSLLLSQSDTNNDYLEKRITATGVSGRRHYPQFFENYGNCSKRAFGLNTRRVSGDVFYANQILYTDNDDSFDVWHNYNNTYSKDIDTNGVLTPSELNNFVINGDPDDNTLDIGFAIGVNINDEVFLIDEKFTNITKVSAVTGITKQNLPIIGIGRAFNLYSDSNGSKVILQSQNDTTLLIEFWTFDTDLTNFEKVLELPFSYDDYNYNLPSNYGDVPMGNPYMICGGNEEDNFKYLITNKTI